MVLDNLVEAEWVNPVSVNNPFNKEVSVFDTKKSFFGVYMPIIESNGESSKTNLKNIVVSSLLSLIIPFGTNCGGGGGGSNPPPVAPAVIESTSTENNSYPGQVFVYGDNILVTINSDKSVPKIGVDINPIANDGCEFINTINAKTGTVEIPTSFWLSTAGNHDFAYHILKDDLTSIDSVNDSVYLETPTLTSIVTNESSPGNTLAPGETAKLAFTWNRTPFETNVDYTNDGLVDEVPTLTGPSFEATHAYPVAGFYTVACEWKNQNGDLITKEYTNVSVEDIISYFDFSNLTRSSSSTNYVGDLLEFSVTSSRPFKKYEVHLDDGFVASNIQTLPDGQDAVTAIYLDAGTHLTTAKIYDESNNLIAEKPVYVTTEDGPPPPPGY